MRRSKLFDWILGIGILLIVWTGIAYLAQNPFICPYPAEVFGIMIEQVQTFDFYTHIFATIARTLFAFSISFSLGILLAIATYRHKQVLNYIEKVILILRSIPNITFIILFLFWFNREWTITCVSFLLLFPIVFQNSIAALQEIDTTWKDVLTIYPQPLSYTIKRIYIPLMKSSLQASAVSTLSLAFKVGVMAEILAQVPYGIGRSMQWEKLNVNLAGVMAWTIWLILLVFIFNTWMKRIGDKTCH